MKIDDLPEDEYVSVIDENGKQMECQILGMTDYDGVEYFVCKSGTTGQNNDFFVLDSRAFRRQFVSVSQWTSKVVIEKFASEYPDRIPEDILEGIRGDDLVIDLTDEEGNEMPMEVLDFIEEGKKCYMVCIEADNEEADEVVILEVKQNYEEYFSIDDEILLQHLFDVFKERNKERFDFI